MISEIKLLLGEDSKRLKKPIVLLVIDSLFNMVFYGMLYKVLLDILADTFSLDNIKRYTFIMIIAFILRTLVLRKGYTLIQVEGSKATRNMRIKFGDHLRNLNLGYFNKNSIGNLTNIMTNDLQDFEKVITHSTSDLIKTVIISIYLLSISFLIDIKLAFIQLLIVLIASPVIYLGGVRANKIGNRKKIVMDDVISRMIEFLSGIEVFKSYNMVGSTFKRLENTFKEFKKESIKTEVAIAPYVLIFQTMVDLSFPLILCISVYNLINNNLTSKETLTFIVINLALTNIIRSFGAQYGELTYLRLACKKLVRVYNEEEIEYKFEKVDFKNYNIEFKNVGFEYKSGEKVLNNITFIAKEKEMTALIGPSGSGKTTITSLIARFFDPQEGSIMIGGIPIKDINPDELLKSISMVFQDVYLINDTIYNNILMGNKKASKEEVIQASKLASCHDFISSFKNGYDTLVGEGGSTLSGGEKQRISIARAILKDSPVILLDEATASLDADNEYEIRKSIDKLTKNKTVIVIAHRLNTIKHADKIIVLNEGEIEEIGNHNQLIENKKRYYNMYSEMTKAKEWSI